MLRASFYEGPRRHEIATLAQVARGMRGPDVGEGMLTTGHERNHMVEVGHPSLDLLQAEVAHPAVAIENGIIRHRVCLSPKPASCLLSTALLTAALGICGPPPAPWLDRGSVEKPLFPQALSVYQLVSPSNLLVVLGVDPRPAPRPNRGLVLTVVRANLRKLFVSIGSVVRQALGALALSTPVGQPASLCGAAVEIGAALSYAAHGAGFHQADFYHAVLPGKAR